MSRMFTMALWWSQGGDITQFFNAPLLRHLSKFLQPQFFDMFILDIITKMVICLLLWAQNKECSSWFWSVQVVAKFCFVFEKRLWWSSFSDKKLVSAKWAEKIGSRILASDFIPSRWAKIPSSIIDFVFQFFRAVLELNEKHRVFRQATQAGYSSQRVSTSTVHRVAESDTTAATEHTGTHPWFQCPLLVFCPEVKIPALSELWPLSLRLRRIVGLFGFLLPEL